MVNTNGLLYPLYNFNGEDLMSINFKRQDVDLVVVSFEKNREPSGREDMRLTVDQALQLHSNLQSKGCRRGMMVAPVMSDHRLIVSVLDDYSR